MLGSKVRNQSETTEDEMLSFGTAKCNQGINSGFLYLFPPISINDCFVA